MYRQITTKIEHFIDKIPSKRIDCNNGQKIIALHYLEFAFSVHVGVTIFVTTGLPIVRVPVLSNTTAFTMANFSRMFPPRKSNPLLAPKEVPTC